MAKQLINGRDARAKLIKGVNIVADAVGSTLGPNGKLVMLKKDFAAPHITKDGFSVAREIDLSDPFEDMGCQLIKEVSEKQVEEVGDGTTTTTVLAKAFINGAFEEIDQYFRKPSDVKAELDEAVETALEYVKSVAQPCETEEELIKVATISANGDKSMGEIVGKAIYEVGENGIVIFEQSDKDELDFDNGINFMRGGINPQLVGNFDNPAILVSLEELTSKEVIPVMEKFVRENKPIVLIAPDFAIDIMQDLTTTVMQRGYKIACIKCPGYGKNIKPETEDLAAALGTTPYSKLSGKDVLSSIGYAGRVEISDTETSIIEPKGDVTEYIKTIDDKNRIAQLTNKVANIKIKALSETEYKERFDRFEDAVCSSKAALEEGIVVGGGITLSDIQTSTEWVNKALSLPLEMIGETNGEAIDPAKVTRCAITYAASVAGTILLTDCLIADEEEKDDD